MVYAEPDFYGKFKCTAEKCRHSCCIGWEIDIDKKSEELANTLQVCFDSGAKKILLPMSSASDISSVPSDLFSKFNISFYNDPEDAVYKALGIE